MRYIIANLVSEYLTKKRRQHFAASSSLLTLKRKRSAGYTGWRKDLAKEKPTDGLATALLKNIWRFLAWER